MPPQQAWYCQHPGAQGDGAPQRNSRHSLAGHVPTMVVLAVSFAMIHPAGASVAAGLQFGFLIALYALGSFVLHNHVDLNIGGRVTALQDVAYAVKWLAVGMVISLVYRA